MNRYLTALVVVLALTSSIAQVAETSNVVADKMEIPRYLPLAEQAGVSGEVTLRLQVKKNGDVISANVVSAHPERGRPWSGFIEMATEAAKASKFSCSRCEGPVFEHTVTYQFQYPAVPKEACTGTIPPPPPSSVDSPSHVTVRPRRWPCVYD
jgi:TonB family protein